jgi:ZIP family zinc transporter
MHKALLLAALTSAATALGGFLAVKIKDRTHIILGLAAGLMLGLVFFDLVPSVFNQNITKFGGVKSVGLAIVLGFLILHFSERWFATHEPEDSHHDDHHHHHAGWLAGLAMVGHVFFDGLGVGAAFKISNSLGIAVFAAIMVHAFSDGLNTVAFLIREEKWTKKARLLLAVDGIARISGAAVGSYVAFGNNLIALYLALFAGFVIYIATSHILPEAHSRHPSRWTLGATIVGVLIMWLVVASGA